MVMCFLPGARVRLLATGDVYYVTITQYDPDAYADGLRRVHSYALDTEAQWHERIATRRPPAGPVLRVAPAEVESLPDKECSDA